jgi:glycerol-3-phosphate acyltransferase PlsY
MEEIFSIILGYLIGSIPFSFVVAKMKGVNLKEKVKNGQIGAAAVKRNCGILAAVLAGAGDFSKGTLAVFVAKKLAKQDWVVVLSGLAAIIGHNWSIFLKFWGGKGALVSFGALFYLLTIPFFLCLPLIIPFLLVKRERIFGVRKTTFFTYLGYFLLSLVSFSLKFPLPISLSPIIFSLPMALKKNE